PAIWRTCTHDDGNKCNGRLFPRPLYTGSSHRHCGYPVRCATVEVQTIARASGSLLSVCLCSSCHFLRAVFRGPAIGPGYHLDNPHVGGSYHASGYRGTAGELLVTLAIEFGKTERSAIAAVKCIRRERIIAPTIAMVTQYIVEP